MKQKKPWPRIIAFLIAVGIAIASFTIGIMQYAHRETGYYEVGYSNAANAEVYDSSVHLLYYAEGGSSFIRQHLNEVQRVFSDDLLQYYRLLSAEKTYEGLNNIAALNAAPEQALKVDAVLYAVLKDAYARHEMQEGYHLFSGALHTEWQSMRYLEEPEQTDPLLNDDEAEFLKVLTSQLARKEQFSLEFDDNNSTVTLHISEEYRNWTEQNEIEAPVLDLNLLHDAYLLQLVAMRMTAQGYTDGYLYTESGISISLGKQGNMEYSLYAVGESGVETIAVTALQQPAAFCSFTVVSPTEERYGYYKIELEGKPYYRHPYVNVKNGSFSNVLMTAALGGTSEQAVDLAYVMLVLNSLESAEAVAEYVSALPQEIISAYTLQNDTERILYTASPAEEIKMQDITFTLLEI
ncbi:MAG: hypothetical protein IKR36_06840 [Clostridia bacterium]|nr:hypothetical protein [Clostridia bacterium]